MKKYSILLIAFSLLVSCKSQYDKAMKSADKDFILTTADEYYKEKKWSKAVALYERATNLVSGTDDMANLIYNSAYANYYDKQYKLAGHQFKKYAASFPDDSRSEDASYMAALCYYEGSYDYNLDQSSTYLAIDELQNFINKYPNSPKAENVDELIDELSYKLEYKAYINAKQYYKMGYYLSADIALENVLEDYPSTKLRPDIYKYIMRSKYELASNSVYSKKMDRIENAMAFNKQVEREYPDSDLNKEAKDLQVKLTKEKQDFIVEKQLLEEEVRELTARQKRLAARAAKDKETEEQLEKQKKQQIFSLQTERDSAELATPPPAATFPIE